MANTKHRPSQAITLRPRAAVVPKRKYEALINAKQSAKKKAREVAGRRMGTLAGVAACAAVGYLEKSGKMPAMMGFEPTLVLGIGLGFIVPEVVKGNAGQMMAEAGAAIAGVAAYKLASGAPIRVGEDDSWSP